MSRCTGDRFGSPSGRSGLRLPCTGVGVSVVPVVRRLAVGLGREDSRADDVVADLEIKRAELRSRERRGRGSSCTSAVAHSDFSGAAGSASTAGIDVRRHVHRPCPSPYPCRYPRRRPCRRCPCRRCPCRRRSCRRCPSRRAGRRSCRRCRSRRRCRRRSCRRCRSRHPTKIRRPPRRCPCCRCCCYRPQQPAPPTARTNNVEYRRLSISRSPWVDWLFVSALRTALCVGQRSKNQLFTCRRRHGWNSGTTDAAPAAGGARVLLRR